MPAVETLGCTTVICSDKTGTLTKGEMTVRKIFVDGTSLDVTGVGYEPVGDFKPSSASPIPKNNNLDLLLIAGTLCSDASLEKKENRWTIKGDPTEGALVVAAAKKGLHTHEIRIENPRIEEIPFSSERKRMTTVHKMESGKKIAFMKGAPEIVLEKCKSIKGSHELRPLGDSDRSEILDINEKMAQEALRVLAIAYREISDEIKWTEDELEKDMIFLGLVGMIDPPRQEAKEAIAVCRDVKIKPIMITGDHKLTAVAVAREIGIYKEDDIVLTGEELEKIQDDELEKIVDKVTVYARVSPMDKIKIVKAWKKRGEVVAMTGDGANDAPALKQADIGVAMGLTGTDVAQEASDMVLNDDNFATIISAIERGRWIYDNIKKYLFFLLQCNIIEVVVIGGAVLVLGPEYLPLLPAAILYINLVTDGLPALALGVAPPDPDIMKRPPRDPHEKVFSKDFMHFLSLAIFLWSPFFLFIFFHDLKDIKQARTEMFFLFIIIELLIALNSRSLKYSFFALKPHKWLVLAIISQFLLTFFIILIPAVRNSLGILLPSFQDMAMILGFGVYILVTMNLTKAYLRRTVHREKKKS